MCDVGYLCANLDLSVLDLGLTYATDRQTDVRRASSLNVPYPSGGAIIIFVSVYSILKNLTPESYKLAHLVFKLPQQAQKLIFRQYSIGSNFD